MSRDRSPGLRSIESLIAGTCPDPGGVLGPLEGVDGGPRRVRVFRPDATGVEVRAAGDVVPWRALDRIHPDGVFEGEDPAPGEAYRLRVTRSPGDVVEVDDPYRFPPALDAGCFRAFAEGRETRLASLLGARLERRDDVDGTRFAVWAPDAIAVNLMGSFNEWEGRRNPMWPIGAGVWELFLPGVGEGEMYKYEIRACPDDEGGDPADLASPPAAVEKTDPMGLRMELRPRTASLVESLGPFEWGDGDWMSGRADRVARGAPISIYEVHAGSWRRRADGGWQDFRDLSRTLLPYVRDLGFTHVELLPITEHPHDASWGYQTVGYFALTARYGEPDDFRAFVDEAHRLGIGVLLDWVPAHFPYDAHGLWRFDGRALYEHPDPRRGHHPDWGTAIFDFGKPEVVSFLVSSARFWLDEYHVDGLRVDAVASMLYLDYSRAEGEWEPNVEGGRENLEAVAFLRRLTGAVHAACPGALLCAEESTAWPGITAPAASGGLGFDLKWNMGWMNDSLAVVEADPADRPSLHQRLTFSMHYAYSERYLLPLSHDEVVHLKRSLIEKMPGDEAEQLAGLRTLFGYMWTHPGAKLLFMGGELGQRTEWDENGELSWGLLQDPRHQGLHDWVRALNRVYRSRPPLHALDHDSSGFEWVDAHDATRSVLGYLRWAPDWDDFVAVFANFSDRGWPAYRAPLPAEGDYEILLDSDAREFGGTGRTRLHGPATAAPHLGRPASLGLDLPPLSVVMLIRTAPTPSRGRGA